MLRKAAVFIFLALNIFASDLDELFIKLENNSNLIQAQRSIVSAKEKDISIQTSYKNPKLSFGANDILLNRDKYNRFDLEPMQTQYIALSQEIEDSDKLSSKKSIALYALKKENLILEDMYYSLVKDLRMINMQVLKSKETLTLLDKKIENLKTLKQYFLNTTSSLSNISFATDIDEKIYKSKDQKYNLLTKIENLKNSYSYILGEKYEAFDDDLDSLKDTQEFDETPKYKAYELEQSIAKEQINAARLEKSSNITVNLAYNRRENFDDYLNLSIAIPLPVYGTEDEKIVKNNELFRKSTFLKDDFLRKVKMKYENYRSKKLFLENSLADISLVLESLNSQVSYSHGSFESISNTPKILQSKNTKIDFQIKKVQLQEQIEQNRLEIDYITTKSKL